MSEYWKSTPKYWCKFCKTYVRDTPLEKKQHEATGKHQGAIQKSLRDLHKNQSREERAKDKAKSELARLNGLVSGSSATKPSGTSATTPALSVAKAKPHFTHSGPAKASADDRRRQAEQLAAMGVAVPDEFRKDMSIASEWSTVSATPIYSAPPPVKKEEDYDEDSKDGLLEGTRHESKRRRVDEDAEDEDEKSRQGKRKVWGTTLKAYPGATDTGNMDDFDALLSSTTQKPVPAAEPEVKGEEILEDGTKVKKEEILEDGTKVKKEVPDAVLSAAMSVNGTEAIGDGSAAPVVFKKRKGKR